MENTAPKILIVDDMEENIHLLTSVVKNHGYLCEVARSGFEAIKQAKSHQPDLILMDVKMPGLNGFETCRIIKDHERLHHIPVVFVTTETGNKSKQQGFDAGAEAYLTKPIQLEEMVKALHLYT